MDLALKLISDIETVVVVEKKQLNKYKQYVLIFSGAFRPQMLIYHDDNDKFHPSVAGQSSGEKLRGSLKMVQLWSRRINLNKIPS